MGHWKADTQVNSITELIGFVEGLADDAEAVANGCTESWSNGMVEGSINKVKWIKRAGMDKQTSRCFSTVSRIVAHLWG